LAQLSSAAIALLWIAAIAVLGLADRLIDPLTQKAALVAAFFERLAIALNCFHCPISEIDYLGRHRALAAPTSEAN
jgi:hypothetical protein